MHIWDAAGDHSVLNLAHLFIENTSVAVLCYAIDDKRSYEDLENWSEQIQDKDGMFTVCLGNKEDLAEHRSIPVNYAKKKMRDLPNCKIGMETSAYENVNSIKTLFQQIGQIIIDEKYY